VPIVFDKYPGLGTWCSLQRFLFKSGKLPLERKEQLAALGFWGEASYLYGSNGNGMGWDARFAQLQEFKAQNGHCRVPLGFKENHSLAKWVSKQRQLYVKGKLRAERIAMLERIGFEWVLRSGRGKS
jgi:hypothetical protein